LHVACALGGSVDFYPYYYRHKGCLIHFFWLKLIGRGERAVAAEGAGMTAFRGKKSHPPSPLPKSCVRLQEVAVAIAIADYLIDQSGIDWNKALASWSWLLPSEFTLWLVNRFADLFLVVPDGTVLMLDVAAGTLTKVAESRDDFCTKIDEGENANQWLLIPLVDRMVATGVLLQPGHCYGFRTPPVLGGNYTVENAGPLPVWDYLGAYGSIHEQLRDVPDGCQVVLKVVNKPAERDAAPDLADM
jgi:hypothetical protein